MISGSEQLQLFESALFESTGIPQNIESFEFISGGCINNAVKVVTKQGLYFVKWNVQSLEGMFEAEAKGLALLRSKEEIFIPEVYGWGKHGENAYLLLEFIQSASPRANFWEDFGASLARLHRHSQAHFGLSFNNYIGPLEQQNDYSEDGIHFFIEKRLKPQAGLALYEHKISQSLYDKFIRLFEKLPKLLPQEPPALLHGDLWSGNFMVNQQGAPALIDPAVYYGYREAELAFTRLFGGFQEEFYQAYHREFPLEPNFQERLDIYNLYPLLVHVNLFGSGYLSGVTRTLNKYLG